MITVTSSGSFKKTEDFLSMMKKGTPYSILQQYGVMGVNALASATPRDTGLTASSWTYQITKKGSWYNISWHNTNIKNGVPVAIILQYGHGTGTGGWVAGRDYINPAIQPIFDRIANDVWKQVTNG